MIETIKTIKENLKMLNKPIPDEMKFRPSWEMAQREAKVNIEKMYTQLAEEVGEVAVAVFVNGSTAKKLSEEMLEQTPGALVDLDSLYAPLVGTVRQSMSRTNEFSLTQFVLLIRELKQLASDVGIGRLNSVDFSDTVVVAPEALHSVVLDYVDRACGVDLATSYMRKIMAQEAVKTVSKKTPVFPVYVINCPTKLQVTLGLRAFKRGISTSVVAPEAVTEEAAIETLKTIQKQLKNKE